MNRAQSSNRLITGFIAVMILTIINGANAVPVTGQFIEDPIRCDVVPNQVLTHELGDVGAFPINEAFTYTLISTPNVTVCVPDDTFANDWSVQITNQSGIAWQDLFLVGDVGTNVGNSDGDMSDVVNVPGVVSAAFRIDGTVTITGMNDNLLSESGPIDEIFDPGETWVFHIDNFFDQIGNAAAPVFTTPGQFSGSSPPGPVYSNLSILANPVPEPTTLGGLILLAARLFMSRGKRGRR